MIRKLRRSVCTTLVFPESRKKIEEFRRMAEYLARKGIDCIEFYHDGDGKKRTGAVLADTGLQGVYIGVIPSKEQKLHLCDTDPEGRKSAVDLFKKCMDEAAGNGIGELMINSGRIGVDIEKGLDALHASIEELFDYKEKGNRRIDVLMEPCDSWMDACQLIGPYSRALAFVERAKTTGFDLGLTMDTAHTVEEGEDFLEALKAVRGYCSHVHFANCRISDPNDPLYGDKHLGFEYAGTVWTADALRRLYGQIDRMYEDDSDVRIAIEVLCREQDPYAYFEKMWASLPFLHA